MPLDAQTKALLDKMVNSPPRHSLPLEVARQQAREVARLAGEVEPVAKVVDMEIPGPGGDIPVRFYYPQGEGPFPAVVYFHGGGWVICDLESHDPVCRMLANRSEAVVMAVDYRRAPENKFPAAVEDAYMAACWLVENAESVDVDPARVAVAGDSAGGNLATVVALLAKEHGNPPLVFQLLVYPITDYYSPGTPSYEENAEGYYLTKKDMIWFWNNYISEASHATSPYAAPLRAPDLSGLPPALIITVEYDPLRDEGEAYAKRLQEAGVSVKLSCYNGTVHNFFRLGGVIEQGNQAMNEAGAALKAAFQKARE